MFSFCSKMPCGTVICVGAKLRIAPDSAGDQLVTNRLRAFGGNGHNADVNPHSFAEVFEFFHWENPLFCAECLRGKGFVGVERGDDMHAVFRKAFVVQKRSSELPGADQTASLTLS